jgi:hypothetical protein
MNPVEQINHACRIAAELGHTRTKLPFGGLASSIPEDVREPKVPAFVLLAGTTGTAFLLFALLRLLLW